MGRTFEHPDLDAVCMQLLRDGADDRPTAPTIARALVSEDARSAAPTMSKLVERDDELSTIVDALAAAHHRATVVGIRA